MTAPGRLGRVDAVDGLRTMAMTMVIAQHCGLMPFGWLGVWVFYVISGYVITRTLLVEDAGADRGLRYRLFAMRRFFRIVPVYILYLAINVPFILWLGRPEQFRDVPFLLGFVYNWQMIYQFWPVAHDWAPFGHLWTISVEEQFYVFYPLLLLFLPRRTFRAVVLALVVAGPFIRLATALVNGTLPAPDQGWVAFSVYASSIAQFDSFLIGALLALNEGRLRQNPRLADRLLAAAGAAMAVYVVTYMAVNALVRGDRGVDILRNIVSGILSGQGREVFLYSAVAFVAAGLVASAIAGRPLLRPFAWRPLVTVGRVSYGGYLYHTLVLMLVGRAVEGVWGSPFPVPVRLVLFVLVWTISVAVATLSFRLFEARLIDISHRISRRASRSAEPEPALAFRR